MNEQTAPPEVSIVIPVYRDAMRAAGLVDALLVLAANRHAIEVIVVDDGSADGTAQRLEAMLGSRADVVALARNQGRSVARNEGAKRAGAPLLFFIDCDCLPQDDDLIAAHMRAWMPDTVATTGDVRGCGHGFWERYQSDASARRLRQHRTGSVFSGSSQNLMVRREAFLACGGFDADYRTYGFEDRDLLLRIARHGDVAWAHGSAVRHMDTLTLPLVCRKMKEAGGAAAQRFAAVHRDAYRALGYARLDARLHPVLRGPGLLASRLVDTLAAMSDPLLDQHWLPYPLRRALAKALAAASFMAGTAR